MIKIVKVVVSRIVIGQIWGSNISPTESLGAQKISYPLDVQIVNFSMCPKNKEV